MAARSSTSATVAVAVAVALLVFTVMLQSEVASASITCGTVSSKLSKCASYLTGGSTAPSAACCAGVKSLYSSTKNSRPDRITACGCLKQLSSAFGTKLKTSSAAALAGTCGVNLGFTISPSINCNAIP